MRVTARIPKVALDWLADKGASKGVELPMGFHLLTPERLDTLLATAGLTVVDRLGDYAGSAFDAATSPYYVACCRGA